MWSAMTAFSLAGVCRHIQREGHRAAEDAADVAGASAGRCHDCHSGLVVMHGADLLMGMLVTLHSVGAK